MSDEAAERRRVAALYGAMLEDILQCSIVLERTRGATLRKKDVEQFLMQTGKKRRVFELSDWNGILSI